MNALQTMEPEGRDIVENKGSDVTLSSFSEIVNFSERASKTQMVPKGYHGKPDDIVVAIMQGMELGLRPLQSLKAIAVINGIPSLYGDAPLALVYKSGKLEFIEETLSGAGDDMVATCRVKRVNQPQIVQEFSVADAKKAQLWGKTGPWQTAPKRMLKFRARAFALRDGFPDVLNGIDVYEEVIERPDMRDVTPKDEPEVKGTAGLKSKLSERKQAEPQKSTLADVEKAMKAATDQVSLDRASKLAGGLSTEDEKTKARKIYALRRDEIKAAANTEKQGGMSELIMSDLRNVSGPQDVELVMATYREQIDAMEADDPAAHQAILALADERERDG